MIQVGDTVRIEQCEVTKWVGLTGTFVDVVHWYNDSSHPHPQDVIRIEIDPWPPEHGSPMYHGSSDGSKMGLKLRRHQFVVAVPPFASVDEAEAWLEAHA